MERMRKDFNNDGVNIESIIKTPVILAVDDRASNLTVLSAIISTYFPDAELITAGNAIEGLELLEHADVDLALLDFQMPVMDGIEMCRKMKASTHTAHIPIVLITAHRATSEMKIKGLEAGADDFIAKPIESNELTARIKVMLRIKRYEDVLRIERDSLKIGIKRRTQKLKSTEERYRTLFNSVSDAIFILNTAGRFLEVNEEACRRLGYSKEEMLQMTPANINAPGYVEQIPQRLKFVFEHGSSFFETVHMARDGTLIPTELSSKMIRYDGESVVLVSARDITERRRAEESLKQSEIKFKGLVESLNEGIWVIDENGRTTYVNPRMAEILEYSVDEMQGKHVFDFIDPAELELYEYYVERRKRGVKEQHDFQFIRKDGVGIHTTLETSPLMDDKGKFIGSIAGVMDITDRKQAQEKIRAALADKEVLIRELYHRTRNNMQLILSMLILKSARSTNEELLKFVGDMKNRIQAMSLVHQKLYQSQDLSRIRLNEYIQDLTYRLIQNFKISSQKISVRLELDDIQVLIDTAIPCGLILCELLSNALSVAFPGDRRGEIVIRLNRIESGQLKLVVADNGIGVPNTFDFRSQKTLGLQTIFAITEGQMQGSVHFDKSGGVACTVVFSDELYTERV